MYHEGALESEEDSDIHIDPLEEFSPPVRVMSKQEKIQNTFTQLRATLLAYEERYSNGMKSKYNGDRTYKEGKQVCHDYWDHPDESMEMAIFVVAKLAFLVWGIESNQSVLLNPAGFYQMANESVASFNGSLSLNGEARTVLLKAAEQYLIERFFLK